MLLVVDEVEMVVFGFGSGVMEFINCLFMLEWEFVLLEKIVEVMGVLLLIGDFVVGDLLLFVL